MRDDSRFDNPIEVSLTVSGGTADQGELSLEDYRISLGGWESAISLSARLYFMGERADPTKRGKTPFELRIRAPERGSVVTQIVLILHTPEFWMGAGSNVAMAAVYDLLKLTSPGFIKWTISLLRSHVDTKRQVPNIEVLAANLQTLINDPVLAANQLAPLLAEDENAQLPLLEVEISSDDRAVDPPPHDQSDWLRQIVESLDVSLEEASRPISNGCSLVALQEIRQGIPVESFALSESDHAVLLEPLSYGQTDDNWEPAKIKFRRIDRDSGSVMFRREEESKSDHNYFGYIADKSYRRPHNPYTQALDADAELEVWLHHENTKTGGIRYAVRAERPLRQELLPQMMN